MKFRALQLLYGTKDIYVYESREVSAFKKWEFLDLFFSYFSNVQPSQSAAISEATEVEPDRSVSTTADGVALSIETIRERVRLKAWLIIFRW